jgi:stage V sporulation protein D (sporulation-specific penicillin-binding protein)
MQLPFRRKRQKRPDSMMRGRIAWLVVFLSCVGFVAVGVRLFWMQVVQRDFYEERAMRLQTHDSIIEPRRGTIYDRNMKVLAESASTEEVNVNPARLVTFCQNNKLDLEEAQEAVADILSENLEMVYDVVLERVQRTDKQEVLIKGGIEKDIVNKINEDLQNTLINSADSEKKPQKLSDSQMVYTDADTKRYYPYGAFLSQVVGFLNNDGAVGGIELQYDEVLSGTAGRIVRAQNARNLDMPFEYTQYTPAEDGGSVVMTVDETVQHYLEKHLETGLADNPNARGGISGVIMEVKTGNILGMANMPDFDLNNYTVISADSKYYTDLLAEIQAYFTEAGINGTVTEEYICENMSAGLPQGLTEEQKEAIAKLRTDKLQAMWRNHIVSDFYEPGSTFKLMTVATGLETHAISEEDPFYCGGAMVIRGWDEPIKCHNTGGHGPQTLTEALMNSCNVAMMQIVFKITPAHFFDYFEAFGLTEKVGIDLPGEQKPSEALYFDEEELTRTPSNLAVTSFGQRFNITPLHMITMISAIVDDGKLKTPHMVKQVLNSDGSVRETIDTEVKRQVVSEKTSAFMRQAMERVVADGTGKNAYVAGYRVGGKTATSEILGKPGDLEDRYTASFIGVAPMDDPQIAVLVAIQDLPYSSPHGGGAIAAPIVGRILTDILPYLGVEQRYDDSESDRREMEIPSIIGQTKEAAQEMIENAGLDCRFVGDGDTVTDQVPSGGMRLPSKSKMIVYLGGEKTTEMMEVPNLLGEHPSTAKERLESRNLYLRRAGIKTSQTNNKTNAVQQNPSAGAQVPVGTVITVTFENSTGVSDR